MSMNLNKVMVAGRLTRDPELKQLPNGNSVTNLGFVTNRKFTTNDERKEEATFLDIKAWGKSGENIAKYLEKRRGGMHHMCVEVDDIDAVLAEDRRKGVRLIDEEARPGAHGKRIAFIHPAATGGVLLELSETPDDGDD